MLESGIWDLTVEKDLGTMPQDACALSILSQLEAQLAALDLIGAHIAAAHVDAAIQQLRRDQIER